MISKNFTKYFQIPLYWLTLLVFFFLVSSLIPMLTGYFVSLLTSGTDKHEVFRIFGPNFPRLMSFLSSLAFSIALSLFKNDIRLVENPPPHRFHQPCR